MPRTGDAVVSAGVLKIGGNAVWGEWFAGLIDEVRIFNRALTAGELQTVMNTPVTAVGARHAGANCAVGVDGDSGDRPGDPELAGVH